MNASTLVFRDEITPAVDLIAQMQESPLCLAVSDVSIEEPGHPIEGENWRPQLAPYKPWVHDAALDETDELAGTDGDLLIVGALGMGITDEERMALIGDAVHGTTEVRETSDSIRETRRASRETYQEGRETSGSGSLEQQLRHFATNVPLTVRRDGDGFAVSAVHLSVLAEHGLPADNLVAVVPSSIDGVPVKRIASEAFARRYTSGAHVRLLMVPDTVEVVGAQAFGSVCAETVYLGVGVRTYDPAPLDMALPNPRLGCRQYLVSVANERFAVQDGCLLEKMGDALASISGAQPGVGARTDDQDADSRDAGNQVADGRDADTLRACGSWRLLFAEAPYEEQLALPDGVRVVGPAAFAKGCQPPRVLDAPGTLERVDSAVHPETIWRGSAPAALARIVRRCGGRVTDFSAVEQDGCWYDFADGEARLVAGPPAPDSVSRQFSSAAHARAHDKAALSPREIAAEAAAAMVAPVPVTDRLALPREVNGFPLTTIAERALITAPATLAVPDTVRAIGDGNACKGTRKLMLPEGLRSIGAHCFCSRSLAGPVLIPASVTSIGEGSFEYAVVRLAAADAVVHITSDQLLSCFTEAAIDGVPFDFERYDSQLIAGRGLPDHLGALLHRLTAPFRLAPEMRTRIVDALRERAADTVATVAREGDIACVRTLAEAGFLDDAQLFDRQIERLRASNRTDCVLFLMNWQHDRAEILRAAAPKRARDRFAL